MLPEKPYKLSLWWIKRDTRLTDNFALTEALKLSDSVLPVAIFEPDIWSAQEFSELHKSCWLTAVDALRRNLELRGSSVLLIEDNIELAFTEIFKLLKFDAVFSHEETGSEITYARDRRVKNFLKERQITWHEFPQSGVIRRLKSRDTRDKIWKARVASEPILSPKNLALPGDILSHVMSLSQSKHNPTVTNHVTERTARETLKSFLYQRGYGYSGGISSPNSAFTNGSRLSEHLTWGTISLRQAYYHTCQRLAELRDDRDPKAVKWRRSLRSFMSRLHWRDHFIQRLESEPQMEFYALNRKFESLPFENNPQHLTAWINGETGVPLVDACMRCLKETGFLNFRMRAMVVSYACHVLHLSWKTIMQPLAALFIDYEPGVHISQLQMQAGVVGINTVRVYSPYKQLLEQDPEVVFTKRWVPELGSSSLQQIVAHREVAISGYQAELVDFASRAAFMKKAIYDLRKDKDVIEASGKVFVKHGSRRVVRKRKKPAPPDQQLAFNFGVSNQVNKS